MYLHIYKLRILLICMITIIFPWLSVKFAAHQSSREVCPE